ncbi:bacteriohemerythrin [Halanaerocella petrolearia]
MVTWSDGLKIGVDKLDKQHKRFFVTANSLLDKCRNKEDDQKQEAAEDCLSFLQGYFKEHFSYEEQFLKEIDYPDYEKHKKFHNSFMNKINNISLDFKQEKNKMRVIINLHNRVLSWFEEHIKYHDRKVADYLQD